jgi:hypothetical protein
MSSDEITCVMPRSPALLSVRRGSGIIHRGPGVPIARWRIRALSPPMLTDGDGC